MSTLRSPLRRAWLGVALGAVLASFGAGIAACYDVPQPVCGFRCGPANACPADYTCEPADGHCHLNGAPPMVCGSLDAGPDVPMRDASDFDGPFDGAVPDAAVDAASDAVPDAVADAAADATADAILLP